MHPSSTQTPTQTIDFRAFEATPGIAVVLLPNHPQYTLVAVSNDFIAASGMQRQDVVGKGHFEVFPQSSLDENFTGHQNLKASFATVIQQKQPDEIAVQRYDTPDGKGGFQYKYWKIKNAPILSDTGDVLYVIHSATDITSQVQAEQTVEDIRGLEKAYQLFMHAPVIIAIVRGPNNVIELANEGMLRIWGKGNEVVGKPLNEVVPELEQQGFVELLAQVRQTGKPYQAFESPTVMQRNGKEEVYYFDFIYQPFYEDGSSEASGVIGVAHDVTERVAARKKVSEVTDRLNFRNALFEAQNEATPDGVLIVDTKGKMLLHNNRFAEIWNMPREVIDARDDDAALKHAMTVLVDPEGFINRVSELYKKGTEKSYDQVAFKDGRIIERNGIPIIGEDGFYYGWAWYFRDITQRNKDEQELQQREEQLRTLVNSISQLAWMARADGWIYWYNSRWYEYTGTTLDDMQGWGWEKVHHPDHLQRVVSFVREAWKKDEPYELTFPLKGKNGQYRWFLTRVYPVKDSNGNVVQWMGTNTDIHEQKQTEALLEEKVQERTKDLETQRNLLDNILQNSSNGISVTEMILGENQEVADARTIMANDAAVQFTGLPRDVYLSTTALALDPGIFASPYGLSCLKTLETGVPSLMQYYLEQTGRWLELTISKMDDTHLIHIFTDVTQMKEAQLQLERTVENLERSNTNLEEFAYAASHDLKEPIRKIHFFSDRLKSALSSRLKEDELHFFERMETAARRMSSLIDDLLAYSQVSQRPVAYERVNLNELIVVVQEDLELEIEERKALITVDPLISLQGHSRQLQQAVQNLLSNALKYSKPHGTQQITISGKCVKGKEINSEFPQKEYYALSISDTGIGFDEKDSERMFNVFTRLHTNHNYHGTGVGLSIVRKVVENHNGLITAEGKVNEGATFVLYLPLEQTAN